MQRSRNWLSILSSLFVDIFLATAIFYLFRYLERSLVESYIRSDNLLGLTEFIVISLLINMVPVLAVLALAQDFIFTFFMELCLTNRRIMGRVSGMFWLKNMDVPIADVETMAVLQNHLSIQFYDGRIEMISGFQDAKTFADAYRDQYVGLDPSMDSLFEDPPDAFTIQSVH